MLAVLEQYYVLATEQRVHAIPIVTVAQFANSKVHLADTVAANVAVPPFFFFVDYLVDDVGNSRPDFDPDNLAEHEPFQCLDRARFVKRYLSFGDSAFELRNVRFVSPGRREAARVEKNPLHDGIGKNEILVQRHSFSAARQKASPMAYSRNE